MPREPDDERLVVDEEELQELERLVRKTAGFPIAVEDELDVPPATAAEVLAQVRQGQQMRDRLSHAQTRVDTKCSFPALIKRLREQARISLDEVATAVQVLTAHELEALEDDKLDALTADPDVMVALMEVFSIHFPLLEESLKRLEASRLARARMGSPMARTTSGFGHGDVERAIRDAAGVLAERQGTAANVKLPDEHLARIRQLLERWGRTDLL